MILGSDSDKIQQLGLEQAQVYSKHAGLTQDARVVGDLVFQRNMQKESPPGFGRLYGNDVV